MVRGRYDEALRGYDAATDISVAAYFEALDAFFPRSRSVLTVREPGEWLASGLSI